MDHSITVVLNTYKRLDLLEKQIESLLKQTIIPKEIFIWNNSSMPLDSNKFVHEKIPIIVFNSSMNFGVWSRFSVALNSESRFVAVMDDDTIPGEKWFENCISNINDEIVLLGTRGLRFLSKDRYFPYESYGWDNPNAEIIEVDIIGHSWFFKRELLTLFWSSYDMRYKDNFCGEDIHLSYVAQIRGYKSYIPPHPPDDLQMWGSQPTIAIEQGTISDAISMNPNANLKFGKAFSHYASLGFRTYYSNNISSSKIVFNNRLREFRIFVFLKKFPVIYNFLKKLKIFFNSKGVYF